MPNPCEPFAFHDCYGPYLIQIHITLPPGYADRLIPEGPPGWPVKYSEVERTLNTAYDQHPKRMWVKQRGGESDVECGATQVYRVPTLDGSPPPIDYWYVQTYLHSAALPVGYRDRVIELVLAWMGTLTTIPLPNGAGDITVEVIGQPAAPRYSVESWD